jgi:hypothetical protein
MSAFTVVRRFPGPDTGNDVHVAVTKRVAARSRAWVIRQDLIKGFGHYTADARAAVRAQAIPKGDWHSSARVVAAVTTQHFPSVIAFRDDSHAAELVLSAKPGGWTEDDICRTAVHVMEYVGYTESSIASMELQAVHGLRTRLTVWIVEEAYRNEEDDARTLASLVQGLSDEEVDDAATCLTSNVMRLRTALWEARGRPPGAVIPRA